MNMTKVEEVAEKFCNSKDAIAKELKRIQSLKCRLRKQKGKKTYNEEMQEIVAYEEVLKEARRLIEPKKKFTTSYTQEDIDKLSYDETIKAIRSIQSKKALTKWLNDEPGNNPEYKKACEIEAMLIAKRNVIKPVDNEYVRKTDVQTIIDTIESSGNLSQERIVELLKELM